MKKIIILVCLALLTFGATNSFAQEKKANKTVSKQIEVSDENGVKTVTITTTADGNTDVKVLTGQEADAFMAKKHRRPHHGKKLKHNKDIEVSEVNGVTTVTITTTGEGENDVKVLVEDDAKAFLDKHEARKHRNKMHGAKSVNKSIAVSDENGEKTVTITNSVDGDETVKVLTGEAAEDFLKKHHERKGKHHNVRFHPKHEGSFEIEVEDENGIKTVTVTKSKAGEKTVEVFTGEEAERFLEHHHKMQRMHHGEGKMMIMAFEDDENGEKTETKIFKKDGQVILVKNNADVTVINKDGVVDETKVKAILMEHGVDAEGLTIKTIKADEHGAKHEFSWTECTTKTTCDKSGKALKAGNTRIEPMDDYAPITAKSKTLELADLVFFPNPNQGKFTVSFTNESTKAIDITVKDLTGKELYTNKIKGLGMVKEQIDISENSSGIYILTIAQGNKSLSKKLLVE